MKRLKTDKLLLVFTTIYFWAGYVSNTLPYGQVILVFSVLGIMITYLIQNNYKIPKNLNFNILTLQLFVFLLYSSSSMLWAKDNSYSINKVNALLFIFLAMIIINMSYSKHVDIDTVLKSIMYGGYLVVLYSFFRYGIKGIVELVSNDLRISNELLNANTIGMCAAYSIIINIYYIIYHGFNKGSLLIAPALIILVATQSRKAIMIIIIGVAAIYVLKNFKPKKIGLSVIKIIIGLIFFIVGLYILSQTKFLSSFIDRMSDIKDILNGKGTRYDNSAWLRFAYIKLGMRLFRKHPLLGIGVGNANIYTQMYYGNNHYLHNNYVEILACLGLVGFMIYYSIFAYLLYYFIKNIKYRDGEYDMCFILLIINLIIDYGVVSYYDKATYLYILLYTIKVKQIKDIKKGYK